MSVQSDIAAGIVPVDLALGTAIPVSQPGLGGQPLTTWVAVLATATLVPATPVAGRAAYIVQAWEGNALPIFIGGGGVTARVLAATPGAADGIMLLPGQSQPFSLSAASILYARATAVGNYIGILEVPAS